MILGLAWPHCGDRAVALGDVFLREGCGVGAQAPQFIGDKAVSNHFGAKSPKFGAGGGY